MLKRKLTTGDYLLILVNIIPVYGVWFEGWAASRVFLVYCLETVIIGIFNVVKMATVSLVVNPAEPLIQNSGRPPISGIFLILFFILHYGIFVFVQTQIFFAVSGLVKSGSLLGTYPALMKALGNDGQLLLLIFIAYYTLQTLYNFFYSGQYKSISIIHLMIQPYGRIFVQQLVVIIGSMFLVFGADKIFILILAAVKIFFEIFIRFDAYIDKWEKAARDKIKLFKPGN